MSEVVIRQTADSDVREYHVDDELTDAPYAQVLDSEMDSSDNFSKLGSNAASLLKSMNGNGIVKLTIRPHSLKVYKNASISWPDIEPNIIAAFERTFGSVKTTFYSKATRSKVFA